MASWAGLPGAVRVEVSAEKGRRLVASRAWAVGQVVFTEQPVAVVMHDCDFASVGEEAVYPQLGEIASRFSVSCDLLKMVLRLYLFLQQKDEPAGGTGEQQALFTAIEGSAVRGTAAAILMLEAHLAKQDTRWTSAVTAAAQALAPLVLPLAAPGSSPRLEDTQELLVALAARVNVNAYGILHPGDPPSRPRGFCMLPVVGLTINHSCDPNCAYVFDPRSGCMQYRSTRAIAAGEELTVSYVDALEDTHARRAVLLASKHFWCGCARCAGMDEVEARVRRGEAWDLLAEDLLGLDLDAPPAGGGKKGKGGKGGSKSGGKAGGGGGGGGPPGLSRALQLADAQLGGLCCPQCPPGCGVIIGFAAYPAGPAPGEPKAAGCLLCGLQVPAADAEASLQRHAAGWQQQQQLQRGGGGGAAAEACEAVERWLQGADPLSAAGAKAPAARRRGPLSLQLHPNHALLLEAHVKLASLCLQLQQQQQQQQQQHAGAAGKAVQALQRAARITAGVVGGDHHPELISLLGHLGDALALAATPQSLRERADVLERVRKARVLAFGADADDN